RLTAEMPLHELRRAMDLSQATLAQLLGANQPQISKIEHSTDLYLSTLRRYIEAIGGQLQILASFPPRGVRICQVSEINEATVRTRIRTPNVLQNPQLIVSVHTGILHRAENHFIIAATLVVHIVPDGTEASDQSPVFMNATYALQYSIENAAGYPNEILEE